VSAAFITLLWTWLELTIDNPWPLPHYHNNTNTPISRLTLGLRSQKHPTCTELGTFCTHIFKIIFSIEVKTVLLFWFFNFHSIIWSEIDKMFEDRKILCTTPAMGANITWLKIWAH
jgi:hypothetical protein